MVYVVDTVGVSLNRQWKCSSAISKSAMSVIKGISASFFRINTDVCIIHDSISFG
jgi:hypothetical protein